jgi:hypothetical protein
VRDVKTSQDSGDCPLAQQERCVGVGDAVYAERDMYEHRSHRLLPWPLFLKRAGRHVAIAFVVVVAAVGVGTIGYRVTNGLGWVDAFLNASMILSGMGPVDRMESTAAKLFAAIYALFSGLLFIGIAGLVLAPWLHRLLHRVHLDGD